MIQLWNRLVTKIRTDESNQSILLELSMATYGLKSIIADHMSTKKLRAYLGVFFGSETSPLPTTLIQS
jgi:hypothetical protein